MKRWKKIVLLVLSFNLLFFAVESKKRETDAAVGSMTLAAITAGLTTSAALPYILGAAGIIAVGGVIKNWDTVSAYGAKVIERMGQAAAENAVINNADGLATVVYSPALKKAMANAVDDVPAEIPTVSGKWVDLGSYSVAPYYTGPVSVFSVGQTIPKGYKIRIEGDLVAQGATSSYGYTENVTIQYSQVGSDSYDIAYNSLVLSVPKGAVIEKHIVVERSFNADYPMADFRVVYDGSYGKSLSITNLKYIIYGDPADLGGATVPASQTFGGAAATAEGRLINMNTVIGDNQAVSFNTQADLTNATLDNLAEISQAQLDETTDQTTIFQNMLRELKSIPTNLVSMFTLLFNNLKNHMSNLWEDAGKVWDGMANDVKEAKGILDQILTGAMENLRAGIEHNTNTLVGWMDNIRGGIDALSGTMAGWLENLRTGIDEVRQGLVVGFGDLTAGLVDWTTSVVTGIQDWTAALNMEIDRIEAKIFDLPNILLGMFIPPDFSNINNRIDQTKMKFRSNPFGVFTDALAGIFGNAKSIYDITIMIKDKNYFLVPIGLKPGIDWGRNFFTGVTVLFVSTTFYNRAKGLSWWRGGKT